MPNTHPIFCISELDDEDIVSQAVLFFLAGFDTTSTLLCFVCHQLATNPDVQKRLQEETDKTMQENGGKFTYEAVHSMKYLDMVVSGEKGPSSHTRSECRVSFTFIPVRYFHTFYLCQSYIPSHASSGSEFQ
jgi:cytochrome P450 family 9